MDLQALISNLTSGDDDLAESTVEQIAAQGTSALPALFDLLDSPDADTRWWVLRALAVIPDPRVLPRLRDFLHDPNPAVRQCATLGMSQQPDTFAIPDLITILDDDDRLLARLGGDALIAIGGPAVTALVETLENGPQPSKVEAARALAMIGDTRAIQAMFAAWEDGSALIRYWVEAGFERMGVGMQFFAPE